MGVLSGDLSLTVLIFAEAGFAQIETSREMKRHASNRPQRAFQARRAIRPEREVLIKI